MLLLKVIIIRDRESAGGGIFNYYEAIAPHLRSDVRFLSIGRPHSFYGGAKGRLLGFTLLRLPIEWFGLVALILSFRPDIVHVNPSLDPENECRSLKRDAVSIGIARLFRVKAVSFWRGWNNECCGLAEMPGGNRGWMCMMYQRCSAQIVLASRFGDDLVRWGFKMPVHVETTVVSDRVLDHKGIPRESAVPFRILFLSRVEEAKGVFEMMEAFVLLQDRHPGGFELVVAGDGPGLKDLRMLVSERRIEGVVFTGYVEGDIKNRCFADADAFCFLSYTEGMPNAVLEAMAMGLPLVSSDAGGLKDILTEGLTGYLVQQDRTKAAKERFPIDEVAERLERLARSDVDRVRMGKHNAADARERFAAKKVAARLDAIYQKVVG